MTRAVRRCALDEDADEYEGRDEHDDEERVERVEDFAWRRRRLGWFAGHYSTLAASAAASTGTGAAPLLLPKTACSSSSAMSMLFIR